MDMIIGDVVRMTHWTHHDPAMQLSFKAPKQEVAVFVLVGSEPRDGSKPLDVESAMRALGWVKAVALSHSSHERGET